MKIVSLQRRNEADELCRRRTATKPELTDGPLVLEESLRGAWLGHNLYGQGNESWLLLLLLLNISSCGKGTPQGWVIS